MHYQNRPSPVTRYPCVCPFWPRNARDFNNTVHYDPARWQENDLENQPIDNMNVTHYTLAPFTPDDERDSE
ncbi:hypothetical protein SI65_00188 [Aspergillus cristatus]|uniref:Uncharacterized protein n=1 Tax=Aspergillus cristatus TaxID=573508 RepID=A0A1E3BNS7_ASPCR|nr:hypothetical protein SI65_00188 [Aspergillus cristatus]